MLEEIQRTWQDFAQKHVYAYRCVEPAIFELHAPDHFRRLLGRSKLETIEAPDGQLLACLVFENPEGSEMPVVHWAWTHPKHRNLGHQRKLWAQAGFAPDTIVTITHLTVVSERMAEKYGWIFSEFPLYERHDQ